MSTVTLRKSVRIRERKQSASPVQTLTPLTNEVKVLSVQDNLIHEAFNRQISSKRLELKTAPERVLSETNVKVASSRRKNITISSGESKMAKLDRKRKNGKSNHQLIRKYSFLEGQIVFAKLRGYPNWPARVGYSIRILLKY